MAVTYGFYNALNHDRLYDAIQMSSIFDGIIQDGIFSTIGTSMIVTAPEDGMFVDVGPGRAWFNHTWTLNDTELPVEAEAAEVVLDRIDAVILEVNSAAEVRANSIKFLKGTPSSNPVKPTLTHNAEVNQYALAYVTIRAGQTTIFQQDIENVIGTDETPFVTGLLQQVSVERLLLQWDDEFHRYFANFKRVSEADLNTWFNARKDEYDAWYADMEREGAEDLATFDAWFQHMKDQLDEDAAGHLQAEIDDLAEQCEKGSVVTVTTEEASLIGRSCTISQGLNSVVKTFDSNGVAEFPSIPYVGNDIDVRATNGDNIAQGTLTIPYFGRYGIEIDFWAATLDIHSTVEALYGRTLTVSKGGSTVGTTTFDNTGHATFKVHETGTYHISTSTAGGDVYETDVTVTEETVYPISLGLPNGQTVTPVNDIQTWLKCAGITDKAYLTTLADVLNEPATYETLLSDSNACDYMARSTSWALTDADITTSQDAMMRLGKYDYACEALLGNATWASAICNSEYFESVLNVKVPTMTSNTTPSGTASASNYQSEYYPYKAFDNNTSTYWAPAVDGSVDQYVRYEFASPMKALKCRVIAWGGNASWVCKIEGSNDASTWEKVLDINLHSGDNDLSELITYPDTYKYYQFYIVSKSGTGYSSVKEFQLWGRHEAQTGIIHSAPVDTIYYISAGQQIPVCVTDADGIGHFDLDDLPKGSLTLYSTVAKDPDNLSNAYSKQFTITSNTTELWLMPDGALYWWGWIGDVEETRTTNGWTGLVSQNYPFTGDVDYGINSVHIRTSGNYTSQGYGTKHAHDNSKYSVIHTVGTCQNLANNGSKTICLRDTKYANNDVGELTNGPFDVDLELSSTPKYGVWYVLNNAEMYINFICLE